MRRMKEEPEKLYDAKAEYVNEHLLKLHISLPDEKAYAIKIIFPIPYFGDQGIIVAELYPCVNGSYNIDPPSFTIFSYVIVNSIHKLTLSYDVQVEGSTARNFLPKNFIIEAICDGTETFVSDYISNSKVYYSLQEISEPVLVEYL